MNYYKYRYSDSYISHTIIIWLFQDMTDELVEGSTNISSLFLLWLQLLQLCLACTFKFVDKVDEVKPVQLTCISITRQPFDVLKGQTDFGNRTFLSTFFVMLLQ